MGLVVQNVNGLANEIISQAKLDTLSKVVHQDEPAHARDAA